MTGDERLNLIDTAINNGGEVQVNFHDIPDKKSAEELIKKFREFFDKPFTQIQNVKHEDVCWYELEFYDRDNIANIVINIFYDEIQNKKKDGPILNSMVAAKGGGLHLG